MPLSRGLVGGAADLSAGEGLDDAVARAVGDDLGAVHDDQPVDQGQKRNALGDDDQRAALKRLLETGDEPVLPELGGQGEALGLRARELQGGLQVLRSARHQQRTRQTGLGHDVQTS